MIKEPTKNVKINMSKTIYNNFAWNALTWHQNSKSNINAESYQTIFIIKSYNLLKTIVDKMNADVSKKERNHSILVEWKELAQKIEFLFCILSFISITVSPFILFHQYFMVKYDNDFNLSQKCACDTSFT
jgi:hypothetical protein